VKGIEANLDKINAIVLMKPPGVQERGTETHRQNRSLGFIAKLAEWSLPFCKVLIGFDSFEWGSE
jgi:hypothetical protein